MSIIHCSTLFTGQEIISDVDIRIENGVFREIGRDLKGGNVTNAKDYFVMPGMIDSHIHLSGASTGNLLMESLIKDPRSRLLRSVTWMNKLLRAGFTAVRDCGEENALFLRDSVREGNFQGPRIIAAGKPLSQTFGHGEFSHTVPMSWNLERGMSQICDGEEDCLRSARGVLRSGSDFIKIFTTGGVLSEKDRPDQEQFTVGEISAIVNEARKAGTYVAAHAHGDAGIRNAVAGGVKTIEHGTLAGDSTLKLMAEKGISLTPTLSIQELLVRYGKQLGVNSWGLEKINSVRDGIGKVLPKAASLGINILAGTDLGFETGKEIDVGANWQEVILLTEIGKLSPLEALKCATGNAHKIGMPTGMIIPGAPADFLLLEGNPLENIKDIGGKKRVYMNGQELDLQRVTG